jgi:uncharacterized protein (TIGR00297 family)
MNGIEFLAPALAGAIAYFMGALDGVSAIVGIMMGCVIALSQDFNWFLLFLLFFAASSVATVYKYREKQEYKVSQKRRKIENVLGNGLVPMFFALQGNVYGFVGSIATATSDTTSSEIGVLSKQKPVSVLDFKTTVRRGTDGGVSTLGNTFMFLGAGLISVVAFWFFQDWPVLWLGLWGGVFGCTMDSVLGATLERKGLIGNSTVNFLSTLSGGVFSAVLAFLILP